MYAQRESELMTKEYLPVEELCHRTRVDQDMMPQHVSRRILTMEDHILRYHMLMTPLIDAGHHQTTVTLDE
jgi:hypothetical protein